MADIIFVGAKPEPIDVLITLNDGLGLFRFKASVNSGPNFSIISPDLKHGAASNAYGRIAPPFDNTLFFMMAHCLFAGANGAELYLKLSQSGNDLVAKDSNNNSMPSTAKGILLATMQQNEFFSTDIRISA